VITLRRKEQKNNLISKIKILCKEQQAAAGLSLQICTNVMAEFSERT
jgi:hypothetical protein